MSVSMVVRSNDLPRIARELPDEAHRVVAKVAADIEAHAKRNIVMMGAVDTSNLLNSVRHDLLGPVEALVSVGASYGIYVHEGTVRYPHPRPFLRNAVEEVTPGFNAAVAALGRRLK